MVLGGSAISDAQLNFREVSKEKTWHRGKSIFTVTSCGWPYDQFVVRFGEHHLEQLKLKHSNYTEISSSKSRKTVIPALRAQKSCSNSTKNWAGSNFKQECFFSDIYSLFEKYKKQVRTCRTYPKLPRFTVNRIVFSNFTFPYFIFSLPWSASIVTEKPFTKPLKI